MECGCRQAKRPQAHPRVSLSSAQKGHELCIDIIYFEGIPHLHAEDKFTALSACSRLASRKIHEQINTLSAIWMSPRGIPKRLTADSEYDKEEFRAFCDSIGCELIIIATEAHHQNGTIEAGNRVLRMFFRRIRMAEGHLNLSNVVERAVYGKNCCTGSKGASSYELWFGASPDAKEIPFSLRAAYDAKQARNKIFRAIKPGSRSYDDIRVGDYAQIFREKLGWSVPCLVVSVLRNIVTVIHDNRHKTAARSSCIPCDPPFHVFLDPDDCELEPGPSINTAAVDDFAVAQIAVDPRDSSSNPASVSANIVAAADGAERYETEMASSLGEASETGQDNIVGPIEGPAARIDMSDRVLRSQVATSANNSHGYTHADQRKFKCAIEFGATHFVTSMPFTRSSQLASAEEMADAYMNEKSNWSESNAFKVVAQDDLPQDANIIGSHVIYKYKADGSLKARIVPHGHMDDEKSFMRTDAPTMSVEILRLLISLASERGWRLGSLDVKAAYLQADGFRRSIFVRPPSEESDTSHLWKLEKPAYGIVESGRLWFLTAFRALEAHDLRPCPYDQTLFKLDDYSLFVTTQVDNFIFTGSNQAMDGFASYMAGCFKLSELDYDNFSVYGTVFRRDKFGIHIEQGSKIKELVEYPILRDRRRMHDEPVTRAERLFYMSTVGSMLFVGRVTSPILSRMAGVLASALPALTVKDIKSMNATIRRLKTLLPAIAELHFNVPERTARNAQSFLLVFTDANFNEDASKNRAGVLVTRSFGLDPTSPCHILDFCSHKLRRVARSTKAAETLAASEGFDRGYYLGAVMKWMNMYEEIRLILDNSSLYADVSTTRVPKEKRVKVDLALLREGFENGDLGGVIWAETAVQLADALTKENVKSDLRLLLALGEGVLRHSYRDCPIKISPVFQDQNGAKGGVVNDTQRHLVAYTQLTA
jgi:hypothetical protein